MSQQRDASRGAKVMLILHDAVQAEAIARLLTAQGQTVDRHGSAEEALDAIQAGLMPQCIITSPVLPGIDGYRLCRIVRTFPACRHIPILMLTAAGGYADTVRVSSGLGPGVMLADRSDLARLGEQVRHTLAGDIKGALVPVLMIAARGRVTGALRRVLKQHGFHLYGATTPARARRLLRERPPAVVVYDADVTAAREAAVSDHLDHLATGAPLIVLSGASYGAEYLRKGAWMVAAQPVDPERLVALCEQVLYEQATLLAEQGQIPREQRLAGSEERYRALFENAIEGIYRTSLDGRLLLANPALARMFGYDSPNEALERITDIGAQIYADPEERAQVIRRLLKEEEIIGYEVAFKRTDGILVWVVLNFFLQRDASGHPLYIEGTCVDITQRKRAEEELLASEERLQAMARASFEAIVFSENGVCFDVNEVATQMFGYRREELIGMPTADFAAPESREEVRRHVLLKSEEPYAAIGLRKDGSRFQTELRGRMFTYRGREVRATAVRDVSARVQAEQELQAWMRRYELIVEASGQVAYDYIVPTGQITWGASLDRVLGLSPEEMDGGFEQWRALLHPDDRAEALRSLEAAEQACAFWEARYRMRHKDGGYRWIRDRGFFLPGPDGRAYRQLGMMEDITAAQEAEVELSFRATLLATLQESSIEGILVVDALGRILSFNRRFVELWGIPDEVLQSRDDERTLQAALDKIADPEGFLAKVRAYYAHPAEAGRDEVLLADGRTLDRYTATVRGADGTYYGRVWYFRDVTEEKRAAEALRLSEAKYRSIFENTVEGLFQTAPEGHYLSINPAFARIFGYASPEEMMNEITDIGRMLYMHPEERQRIGHLLEEHGLVEGFEAEVYYRDRTSRWISINARSVCDSAGILLYYEGSAFDITARRMAEERLLSTIKQLEDIIEFLPDATLVIDQNGTVLAWNKAMEEMSGLPKAAIIGKHHHQATIPFYGQTRPILIDLIDKDDEELAVNYANVTRKGTTLYAETFAPTLYHGRGAHIMVVASQLFDREGRIVGFIESMRDITERKQAEEALKLSEEKFAKAFNASPVVISISALDDGTYLEVNDAFLKMSGYAREEVIGRTTADLDLWVDRQDRERFLAEIIKTGRVREFETRFHMRDGTISDGILSAEIVVFRGRRCLLSYNVDITERKRAAEALRASEELYRLLTENAYDMISRHDPDGTVRYISPACRRILGYDPEEMIGRPDKSIVHPDDLPGVWDIMNRRFQEGADTYTLQHRTVRKDGSWLWIETAGRFIRNADGSLKEIQCGVRDISERVRALEALRASEEKFRSIVESSPVGMHLYRLEDDGRLILIGANPAADRMLGVKHADLLGRTVIEAFPALAGTEIPDLYFRVARGESGPQTFEFSYQDERFSGSYAVIVFPVGQGSITADFTDITERKRAEEALRTSESFLSSIIDQSPYPMWISDEKGTLIRFNQALLDLLHLSADEVLGKYNIFQDNIVEEQGCMPLVRRVYEEGQAVRFELTWDTTLLKNITVKESVFVILDVTIFPIRDAAGRIAHAVIQHRDITERKRAQAELEELDRELKRKNQELESIVYATSHDLRSPLLNIQGFGMRLEAACADLLEVLHAPVVPDEVRAAAVPILDETIPKSLKFIRSSVEKMDSLIKGLLQLSRLGRAELIMLPLDIKGMLEQVIAAMGFQIQQAGATIELGDLPTCRGDASQLSQVFSNLIDNALKYRAPERELLIRVYGHCEGEQCIYCVEDNGVGIPEGHREKIWELFHRLDPGGVVSGEGLGLTVVRRILDRHKGKVWVEETATGMGSRFCFTLKREGVGVR